MAQKVYDFKVSNKSFTSPPIIELVQGDTNSNIFNIHLLDGKLPMNLYDVQVATLTFLKADGNTVTGLAHVTDAVNGIIYYNCGTNEIAYPGVVKCTIELYGENKSRMTTMQFSFTVRPQLSPDVDITSTTEYTVLQGLIDDVGAVISSESERNEKERVREVNEDTRILNEDIRKEKEDVRVAKEEVREANESVRKSNEDARQANETIRQLNETTRKTNEDSRQSNEDTRKINENIRIDNEDGRKMHEDNRIQNETIRAENEDGRVLAENTRVENEKNRVLAENVRIEKERIREENENKRVTAEDLRKQSETARVTAEQARIEAETARVTAEQARIKAENDRVTAETNRENSFNKAINDFVAETERVEAIYPTRLTNVENDLAQHKLDYTQQRTQDQLKVATVEKELKDYQKTLAQVNVNHEAKQSASGYGTIPLPPNTANGQISVGVNGLTATNIVSEWSAMFCSYSLDSNGDYEVLSSSINGTGRLQQGTVQGTISIGNKIYRRVTVKSDSDKVGLANTTSPYAYHSGSGNFEVLSAIVDATSDTNAISVVDTRTSDWTPFVIKNNSWLRINLTKVFGAGNEPTKEECDKIFANWFDGTKSTLGAIKLKSVGKNLFDGELLFNKTFDPATGEVIPVADRSINRTAIKVLPNAFYTIKEFNPAMDTGFIIAYYDEDMNFISRLAYNQNTFRTFQTPENCYYIRFRVQHTSDDTRIMLQKGSQPTEYEPYKESTAYVVAKDKDNKIVNLKSLPNGVRDEVDLDDGKLIKSVKEKELDTNDILYLGRGTNVDFITFKKPTDYIFYETSEPLNNSMDLINVSTGTTSYSDDTSKTWKLYNALQHEFGLIVPKGTYSSLTDVRTKLAGTKLTYQLAEPEIIPIQVSGNIIAHPNGTIYIEPVVADANVYNDGIIIFEQELNIDYIDKIAKVDYVTGVETPLDVSKAVISEDKKSFTHPDLMNGDMVFFEYFYSNESIQGEATVEYYDSRYVIKDKSLDKFYQWQIVVDNGVPDVELVEV